ncbi:class II glutamine amidotransferase, partial [Paraburkholderia sp. BR14261]
AVIATAPLTDNEVWTRFAPGDLLMFQHGDVIARTSVPVPQKVLDKLANPSLDASASAPCAGQPREIDPEAVDALQTWGE